MSRYRAELAEVLREIGDEFAADVLSLRRRDIRPALHDFLPAADAVLERLAERGFRVEPSGPDSSTTGRSCIEDSYAMTDEDNPGATRYDTGPEAMQPGFRECVGCGSVWDDRSPGAIAEHHYSFCPVGVSHTPGDETDE